MDYLQLHVPQNWLMEKNLSAAPGMLARCDIWWGALKVERWSPSHYFDEDMNKSVKLSLTQSVVRIECQMTLSYL